MDLFLFLAAASCLIIVLILIFRKGRMHFLLLKEIMPKEFEEYSSFLNMYSPMIMGKLKFGLLMWFWSPLFFKYDLPQRDNKKLSSPLIRMLYLNNRYLVLGIIFYAVIMVLVALL